MIPNNVGIPSATVCAVAHVPASTLDYWVRTGLVTPSLRGSEGHRVERWWTVDDVLLVRIVRALRQAGASLQQIRQAKELIESEWDATIPELQLFWDGSDIIEVGMWGELRSVIRKPGQHMLHVVTLPIGQWHREMARMTSEVDLDALRDRAARRAARSVRVPTAAGRSGKRTG